MRWVGHVWIFGVIAMPWGLSLQAARGPDRKRLENYLFTKYAFDTPVARTIANGVHQDIVRIVCAGADCGIYAEDILFNVIQRGLHVSPSDDRENRIHEKVTNSINQAVRCHPCTRYHGHTPRQIIRMAYDIILSEYALWRSEQRQQGYEIEASRKTIYELFVQSRRVALPAPFAEDVADFMQNPQESTRYDPTDIFEYLEMINPEELCCICNTSAIDVKMRACDHLFCEACISQWIYYAGNSTCPLCRADLFSLPIAS